MSLSVHPSTLLHSSLAYLSPQSRFFDALIRHHHSHRTHHPSPLLSLPPELLLLIRTHLHHALTAHLIDQTQCALKEYERALRALLCPDCRSYNEEVFGSSVWSWEGFSGPCSCGGNLDRDRDMTQVEGGLFPKHFFDRQHWVETHLARQHLRLAPSSPAGIWNAVDRVLGEFGCTLAFPIGGGGGGVLALLRNWGGRAMVTAHPSAPWLHRPRYLTVVPSPFNDGHRKQVVLDRVRRDLGLLEFGSEEMEPTAAPPPPKREHDRSKLPLSVFPALIPLRLLAQTVLACLTMPFAFVITLLCFYCTPGTLRLF